jgi:3-deoxy-7-phosphoheptulonate synthase
MIIMEKDATREQIDDVIDEIKKHGLRVDVSQGEFRTIIGLIGDESKISFTNLALMPGVKEARMVETPYKLISRDYSEPFIAKMKAASLKWETFASAETNP